MSIRLPYSLCKVVHRRQILSASKMLLELNIGITSRPYKLSFASQQTRAFLCANRQASPTLLGFTWHHKPQVKVITKIHNSSILTWVVQMHVNLEIFHSQYLEISPSHCLFLARWTSNLPQHPLRKGVKIKWWHLPPLLNNCSHLKSLPFIFEARLFTPYR